MQQGIVVDSVSRSYGKVRAVDGLSFEVRPGETFGFLGPNGAGKSTTLHILIGLLKPDSGSVSIAGCADPTQPSVRSNIGFAPQSLALYEELSGRDNLSFFASLHSMTSAHRRERVGFALDFCGLADRADSRVSTWSGGMKRRLNLACALLHDPPVLLLDEPMVGVDPQSRNHMFETIEKLRLEGRTIIYTTHYMEEAARLCDRVGIIDSGKMLAIGTPEELIRKHGGNSTVVLCFDGPIPAGLPAQSAVNGGTVRLPSPDPFGLVASLAGQGIRPDSLRIDRPDLEKVFLALTGRKLRV